MEMDVNVEIGLVSKSNTDWQQVLVIKNHRAPHGFLLLKLA
jgi:hypothetical protein